MSTCPFSKCILDLRSAVWPSTCLHAHFLSIYWIWVWPFGLSTCLHGKQLHPCLRDLANARIRETDSQNMAVSYLVQQKFQFSILVCSRLGVLIHLVASGPYSRVSRDKRLESWMTAVRYFTLHFSHFISLCHTLKDAIIFVTYKVTNWKQLWRF